MLIGVCRRNSKARLAQICEQGKRWLGGLSELLKSQYSCRDC